MNRYRLSFSGLAVLCLGSMQTGCTTPNLIRISSNDWTRHQPNVARLARCREIEVAIADSSGSVLYGEPNAGMVWGYVLHDAGVDIEALQRIRDQVGQTFVDHLQRAFPDKRVSYSLTNPELSVRRPDMSAQDHN
ncbi:MAG: hypothetical protein JSU86_10320, partial [Phycisphaerales bacterium]